MMITSRDNELIKEVSKLISASKYRKKSNCFVAEGVRLCRDAASSGALIKSFLYTSEAAEKYNEELCIISKAATSSAEISRELYDRLSDTGSPQGFLCVIDMNSTPRLNEISISGKYAALENIQDPSNLGTILRTAEALGVDGADSVTELLLILADTEGGHDSTFKHLGVFLQDDVNIAAVPGDDL